MLESAWGLDAVMASVVDVVCEGSAVALGDGLSTLAGGLKTVALGAADAVEDDDTTLDVGLGGLLAS